eukprot:jgi/Pico_ML_1/50625/g1805.t1
MFYAKDILGKKAPLGPIWIAAHAGDKKLHKRMVLGVNVAQSCENIMNPEVPLALRVIAFLVNGVVIIYQRQQQAVLDDAKDMMRKIQTLGQARAPHNHAGKARKNGSRNSALHLSKYATVTLEEIRIHPGQGQDPRMNTEAWRFHTPTAQTLSRGSDGSPDGSNLDLSSDAKHRVHSDPHRHELDLLAMDEPDQFDMPVDFQDEQDLMLWDEPADTPRDTAPLEARTPSETRRDRGIATPAATGDPAPQQAAEPRTREGPDPRVVRQKTRKKKRGLTLDPPGQLIIDSKTYRGWLHDTSDLLRSGNERADAREIGGLLALPFSGGRTMCEELVTLHRQVLDRSFFHHGQGGDEGVPLDDGEDCRSYPPPQPSSSNEIERMRKASTSSGDGPGPRLEGSLSGMRSNSKTPRSGMGGSQSFDRRDRRLSDLLGTQSHPLVDDLPDDPMQLLLDEGGVASGPEAGALSSQFKHTFAEETMPDDAPRASANMDAIACNVLNFLRSQFEGLERAGMDPKLLSLQKLVSDYRLSRSHAARYFYNVCILASNEFLEVIQRRPYGEILLRPGAVM